MSLRFMETPLAGAYVIDLDPIPDDRGFFARTWCAEEFARRGLDDRLVQSSVSFNSRAGTLRGMHFQAAPHAETRVVRCTRGSIHDVILDLRSDSETHREWFAVQLTPENGRAVYVPAGFAHGFQTLTADTEVMYQMSVPYHPASARGVRWDDPAFGIEWPDGPDGGERHMSDRDRAHPDHGA